MKTKIGSYHLARTVHRELMTFVNHIKYKCVFAILILISVFISGCGFLSNADDKVYFSSTREPDELEYEYKALASEMHSAKPCYLIHPESLIKGGFNSVGSQVSYLRSLCFIAVATETGNTELCANVRSVSTLFLSGANTNADLCRRLAGVGGSSFNLDVPRVVALAGYTEAELDAYLVAEERFTSVGAAMQYRQEKPDTYWGEVRRHLLHSEDFFKRTGLLPGFGTDEEQAIIDSMPWNPRVQRPWVPPEQRARSTPEIRTPASTEQ